MTVHADVGRRARVLAGAVILVMAAAAAVPLVRVAGRVSAAQRTPVALPATTNADFNDSHFHLTNYVQEGTDVRRFLEIMGTRVGRSTLFGIPLQQQWSYGNSGDYAPTYYLHSDAPLYYYSFTDAFIAQTYRSLPADQQARLDPMITVFGCRFRSALVCVRYTGSASVFANGMSMSLWRITARPISAAASRIRSRAGLVRLAVSPATFGETNSL